MLPRTALDNHLQAIAVSMEVDSDLEIRDMGSNLSTMVDVPEIANTVDTVACSKNVSQESEPEPMTPSGGDLHTPVFPDITRQDIPQTLGLGLQLWTNQGKLPCLMQTTQWPSHQHISHLTYSLWLTLQLLLLQLRQLCYWYP